MWESQHNEKEKTTFMHTLCKLLCNFSTATLKYEQGLQWMDLRGVKPHIVLCAGGRQLFGKPQPAHHCLNFSHSPTHIAHTQPLYKYKQTTQLWNVFEIYHMTMCSMCVCVAQEKSNSLKSVSFHTIWCSPGMYKNSNTFKVLIS